MTKFPSVPVLGRDEWPQLDQVPLLYWTPGEQAARQHALSGRAVKAARARWNTSAIVVQSQTVALKPGTHAGIPVAQRVPTTSAGEVAVACLAQNRLLEIDGALASADELHFVASGARWRFHAAAEQEAVVVMLLRPHDDVRCCVSSRHCARVFAPMPRVATGALPAWAETSNLHFESGYRVVAPLPAASAATAAAEPLFAAASPQFLQEHGGPMARAFIAGLPSEWQRADGDVIVQVKRDELSPGWYPALIGWHMDGTSRANRRADGTPDLQNPGRRVEQMLACVGDVAPTSMLRGPIDLPEAPLFAAPETTGGVWQQLLRQHIDERRVQVVQVPNETLVEFGWGGFHTASVATRPRWRLFLKAMRGRGDVPRNERPRRATISWPSDAATMPEDPCGVFPEF